MLQIWGLRVPIIDIFYTVAKMGTYLAAPNTEKKFHSQQSSRLKFTVCEMQGWRRQMEDATLHSIDLKDGNSLFGVFDGHGGMEVSHFVKDSLPGILLSNDAYQRGNYDKALEESFKTMDDLIRSDEGQRQLHKYSHLRKTNGAQKNLKNKKISDVVGCTANVVLITPLVYVVANCGDSRSVLCRKGNSIDLSSDHKPDMASESNRIIEAGGSVQHGRINGHLNLSRGFGDFYYKSEDVSYDKTMVTCKPDIRIVARSPNDEFILIGCDGIFENYLFNNQPLIDLVRKKLKPKKADPQQILAGLFDRLIAKELTQVLGCDNMTAILVELNKKPE